MTALLCSQRILFRVRALTEASLGIPAEAPRGCCLIGGPLELNWLRSAAGQRDVGTPGIRDRCGFEEFARSACVADRLLDTGLKFSGTLLRPAVTAISHSKLLRKSAQRNNGGIGFFHSHSLSEDAHRQFGQRSLDWST